MHALVHDEITPRFAGSIVRTGVVVDVPEAADIEAALTARFGGRVFHYSLFSPIYDCQVIDVFHPAVSKWTGIQDVCKLLGVDPMHAVAIGDDYNDIPMLQNAALSFVMGNAPDELKKLAKRVTGSQPEGGVARVIDGILEGAW